MGPGSFCMALRITGRSASSRVVTSPRLGVGIFVLESPIPSAKFL